MEEVQALCDRATVFRDGTDVGTIAIGEASEDEIVRMMIGRTLHEVFPARPSPRATPEPLLEVRSLGWGSALRDISLTLHRGEIVGLSGLEGQGQGDLLAALFGVYAGLRGDVRIAGRRVALSSPRDAMRAGIALVPEDRKTQGLILALPVRENVTLASPGRVSRGGLVAPGRERRVARQLADRLAIKAPDLDAPVRVLSGGNQQKVAIAKWLLRDAEVYLLADPTRGIDVGAKQEIYALMRGLADQGKGILYFATDQTEIVGLCDRALVMYEGAIVRELSGVDLTEEQLVSAAVGLGRAPSEQRSTATLHESSGTAAGA
jgi:ribose transport system ATP-binding protein